MVVFGNINNDKDPPLHFNTAVKKTNFQISPVTYIKNGGTLKLIYIIFHIISEKGRNPFQTGRPKQNLWWGLSQLALHIPVCCPSRRHLGDMVTYSIDAVFALHLLSLSFQTDYLIGAISCHLQTGCTCRCVTKISFGGMRFGNNEWELMLLATLEWAHREGLLILSFYTIHLQSTWLSAFFSTGNLWLPCWISSKPVCYDYKTLPGPLGSQKGGH